MNTKQDDIDIELEMIEMQAAYDRDEKAFGKSHELGLKLGPLYKLEEPVGHWMLGVSDETHEQMVEINTLQCMFFADFVYAMKKHGFTPNAVTPGTWLDQVRKLMDMAEPMMTSKH